MVYAEAWQNVVAGVDPRQTTPDQALDAFHDAIGMTTPRDRARRLRSFGMYGGDEVAVKREEAKV
jgi:hypothetical protein